MCKVRDAAMNMLEIALAKGIEMDYIKLYKMLYLGQCFALGKYSEKFGEDYLLFEEPVTAHRCGPYIESLSFIPAIYGVWVITKEIFLNPGENKVKPEYLPVSVYRRDIINRMIEQFGKLTTAQLVAVTKGTDAYKRKIEYIKESESRPELTIADMKDTGKSIIFQSVSVDWLHFPLHIYREGQLNAYKMSDWNFDDLLKIVCHSMSSEVDPTSYNELTKDNDQVDSVSEQQKILEKNRYECLKTYAEDMGCDGFFNDFISKLNEWIAKRTSADESDERRAMYCIEIRRSLSELLAIVDGSKYQELEVAKSFLEKCEKRNWANINRLILC